MDRQPDYNRWTKEALIKRIQKLESEKGNTPDTPSSPPTLPAAAAAAPVVSPSLQSPAATSIPASDTPSPSPIRSLKPPKRKTDRKIDPSKYSTRLIAFKLAYVGKNYGGFEFQASGVLPSIEEELWKALVKSCLIFPKDPEVVRWEEWDYSKCGRTDRGVSAFGQVVACRVRSNRPLKGKGTKAAVPEAVETTSASEGLEGAATVEDGNGEAETVEEEEKPFDDFLHEIQYCRILNRLLPPDIRVLAWCPTTPEKFSARHDCRERQYRYFFTQPAYSPFPHSLENPKATVRVKDGWLDIDAMRTAAKKFEGTHDFRNFCKVDPSKLITNFDRRIFECDIVEVKDADSALPYLDRDELRPTDGSIAKDVKLPKVYYFHVRGSAFLWHQIRCMVAVIFMVGQGLEDAAIVDQLLDHNKNPRRPNYVLASEFPLVLWDCVFPREGDPERKDTMDWVYLGEDNPLNKHGSYGLVDDLWEFWRERKMDEILSGQLLNLVAGLGDIGLRKDPRAPQFVPLSQRTFEGGDRDRLVGKYQAMMQKSKLPAPEETYEKEAKRKGYASAAAWREERAKKREAFEETAGD